MHPVITSREAILEASRRLIREQDWQALSIRSVAATCGVSVGSIYNYFDNKSELIAATVQSVWFEIFHLPCPPSGNMPDFVHCIAQLYDRMERGAQTYPGFFALHAVSFCAKDTDKGRQLMHKVWHHIQDNLHTVLLHDTAVRPDAFDAQFTPEVFVQLIFSLILSAVMQQNYDCTAVLEVVHRTLYRP